MFIHQIPAIFPQIFPRLNWKIEQDSNDKNIYFTFDDGPTPEITNLVLEDLKLFNAKATFFCIGKNMIENPYVIQSIIQDGHGIGNHTMNHLNAWKNNKKNYSDDFFDCEKVFKNLNISSVGFRPPYGRLTSDIYFNLSQLTPIFMWSILSGDYNTNLDPKKIIISVCKAIQPGSILVFHDSLKAFPLLKEILKPILKYCQDENYNFRAL